MKRNIKKELLCMLIGHKLRRSEPLNCDICDRCDNLFNTKPPEWAMPFLNEMVRLEEEAREKQGKSQEQIKAEQEARKLNRAPLFEVMEVPPEERTESENQWVREYMEGRNVYFKNLEK
jgi:hypothetical protein